MRIFLILVLVLGSTYDGFSDGSPNSVLKMWADDMREQGQERTFIKLASNPGLESLNFGYSLFYWADSGVWNPVSNKIQFAGNEGSCCGEKIYKMLIYDEVFDQWELPLSILSGSSGHAYDGNALDPITGLHYLAPYYSKIIHVYNDSSGSWSTLPPIPLSESAAPAITWFPDINNGKGGLIFAGSRGVVWYDGISWHSLTPPGPLGEYHTFAEYSPVEGAVWLGGGTHSQVNTSRVHYKLSADLTFTQMDTGKVPFSLSIGNALHAADPVTGKFIVTDLLNGEWWEYHMSQDSWMQFTPLGLPNFSDGTFQVSLPEHGVIMYMDNGRNRNVYLYLHSLGLSLPSPARPQRLRKK